MNIYSKILNILMVSGKKFKAEKILKDTFRILNNKYKKDPSVIFSKSVDNVRPLFEIRSVRIAGRTQQIPFPLKKEKQLALALKWLVSSARSSSKGTFSEKLAFEMHEASLGKGMAIKKRDDLHKVAESSRAFAHFRWC